MQQHSTSVTGTDLQTETAVISKNIRVTALLSLEDSL